MKLTPEQIQILDAGRIEDNKFYLQWQLDRKQYVSINEVLETIGLKWNRKEKAHIFDGEMLEEAIADIISSGEVETLKETIKKFQFYPTPREVVDVMIDLAEIEDGNSVLEPSAGKWAIAKLFPKNTKVTLVELNQECYDCLKNDPEIETDDIVNMDFLEYKSTAFDRIVMNPPFSKSQDVKHILHAYSMLKIWGILVSVASSSVKYRGWKVYEELESLSPEYVDLPEWSFKESGTMVNSVIVVLRK